MLAFAIFDHRGQQHQLGAFRQGHYLVDHLADGLGIQGLTMFWTARLTGASKQKAQIIINFGNGANRRARVVGCRLLLNGDGRGETLDMIHVGLFHHR